MPDAEGDIVVMRTRDLASLLLVIVVLALVPGRLEAQSEAAARAMAEGNERYEQGDYRGALQAYRQVLEAGYASGALYVNIAGAYYRLDELGQAVRFYERAHRYRPDDPMIEHNLEIVREQLPERFTPAPEPFWQRWWRRLITWGAGVFFWPGIVLYGVGTGLLAHRIATRTRSAWHRRALVTSLFGGLVLLAVANSVSLAPELEQRAVVVADEAAVREQPLAGAQSEVFVREGTVVDVLDTDEDWARVRLPNGVVGWIERETTADI